MDVPTGTPEGLLRIGELGRRQGVSPDLLRAWERRYGLLEPRRTAGGFRLYSPADERRVEAMRRHLAEGFSASVAARMALDAPGAGRSAPLAAGRARRSLATALDGLREGGAQALLDRLFEDHGPEPVIERVILPYLHDLGERWSRGEVSVAQEHFASSVLRGRLLALARGWGRGAGPRALLACPPDEHHELGLLCFGIGLRAQGWRITFLGADTPIDTLRDTADRIAPDLVVVCAERREPLAAAAGPIGDLARERRVAIAGRGSDAGVAARLGAEHLDLAPLAAASALAAGNGLATGNGA